MDSSKFVFFLNAVNSNTKYEVNQNLMVAELDTIIDTKNFLIKKLQQIF